MHGSGAEQAGLRGARETVTGRVELGDIIVGIDGKPTETIEAMLDLLEQRKVGDQVLVDILRANRRQQVSITLQAVN